MLDLTHCPKCFTQEEFCCRVARSRHNNVVGSNVSLHETIRERVAELTTLEKLHESTVAVLNARIAEIEAAKTVIQVGANAALEETRKLRRVAEKAAEIVSAARGSQDTAVWNATEDLRFALQIAGYEK
jgi:predicted PilT family ATPase